MLKRTGKSLVAAFKWIRDWLNNNKIFFEVIVMGWLTYMAITVSRKANEIADAQTSIMRQEQLPQFEFRSEQLKNEKTGIYDYRTWYVVNRGGRFSDLDMRDLTFVTFVNRGDQLLDTIRIPVYGYLSMVKTISMESQGAVYTFNNDRNGALEYQLRQDMFDQGYLDVDSYAKISYKDLFGTTVYEYYRLGIGTEKISETEYLKLDSIHLRSKKMSFNKLTPELISRYNPNSK